MTATLDLSPRTWTSAGNAEAAPCPDRLLTVAEAADMLMVPHENLLRMLRAGEIPSQQFEGQLRVKESDVRTFLAELRKRQEAVMAVLNSESQAAEGGI